MAKPGRLRVAFIHPDLGLGGAERLVVDAAAELVGSGHTVDMYTAYYDSHRCFEETKTGGFAVHTAGGWFPRHIGGRMLALCAYIRCILVAIHIAWRCCLSPWASIQPYDVIIADQVAVVVPIVRLLMPRARVLFYCHFPDMLLTQRKSLLKRLYRAPLDYLEEVSTGAAHLILVNSNYTRRVFSQTFTRLAARGINPGVLYPAVPIPEAAQLSAAEDAWRKELDPELASFIAGGTTFLSINRFERKKGVGLALEALHELLLLRAGGGSSSSTVAAAPTHGSLAAPAAATSGSASGTSGATGAVCVAPGLAPRLVVAGGYDPRLAENVEHLGELRAATAAMDLRHVVRFVPSFTDRQRTLLLAACRAVLYTPQHEHFGIVPLEAMAAGRPVVACNSGGPMESVANGVTGRLCNPSAGAFAGAMLELSDPRVCAAMGQAARAHVEAGFSRRAFGEKLDGYVRGLLAAAGGGAAGRTRETAAGTGGKGRNNGL